MKMPGWMEKLFKLKINNREAQSSLHIFMLSCSVREIMAER